MIGVVALANIGFAIDTFALLSMEQVFYLRSGMTAARVALTRSAVTLNSPRRFWVGFLPCSAAGSYLFPMCGVVGGFAGSQLLSICGVVGGVVGRSLFSMGGAVGGVAGIAT